MARTYITTIVTFIALFLLSSCKPAIITCTQNKPSLAYMDKTQANLLKYYLPKKVLTLYCPVTVKGKVACDNGKDFLVDKAQIVLSDTALLYEDEEQGEGYYVIIQNDKKSLIQAEIGLSYYNGNILKTINAESTNLGIDMAEMVVSLATSAAQTASGYFTGVRGETKDTSFRFVISRRIELSPNRTTDTIDFKQYFPKMTNRLFFTVGVDRFNSGADKPDSAKNGFIYYDPKYLRTTVAFHNVADKKDVVLLEKNIVFPQMGDKQILYLPHGFADGRILANFNPDGFLLEVSYVKNKEAPGKLQQISGMGAGVSSSGGGSSGLLKH